MSFKESLKQADNDNDEDDQFSIDSKMLRNKQQINISYDHE